jgi:hypothetical protein
VNRDGIADLVSVSASGFVQLATGHGDMTFDLGGSVSTGTTPAALVTGDFDEDGLTDLAVANTGTNNVSVLLEGCTNTGSQTVVVTSPNGGETWQPTHLQTITWTQGSGVLSVDLELSRDNGRNWQPIATNVLATGSYTWRVPFPASDSAFVRATNHLLQNNTDRSNARFTICEPSDPVSTIATAAGGPKDLAVADFDGDGILDVALAVSGGVALKRGQGSGGVGNGTFAADESYPIGADAIRLVTADFNGDGLPDLAVTRTGGVSILLRNPSPTPGNLFLAPTLVPLAQPPLGIVAADFDQDGIVDLAVTVPAADSFIVLRGAGSGGVGNGTFAVQPGHPAGDAPTGIACADFNADGILDLAIGNDSAALPGVTIALGQGSGGVGTGDFGAATRYPTSAAVIDLATGDFDEDGHPDLAVVTSANLSRLAGTGTGAFGAESVVSGVGGGARLLVADGTRDGRADLYVSAGTSLGVLGLFPGNGTGAVGNGTFGPLEQVLTGAHVGAMAMADFIEDGIPDLLVAAPSSNEMFLLSSSCPAPAGAYALSAPNGGEAWTFHVAQNVLWTKPANAVATNVELSRDGGATWERLASGLTGSSYRWQVVGPASTSARMRVVDEQLQNRLAMSAANFTIQATTGVVDFPPAATALTLASPNPSRGAVRFVVSMPLGAPLQLEILDVAGRCVRSLASGRFAAGRHGLEWDGRGDDGAAAGPGVYFARLRAAGVERVRRVVRIE